MDHGGTPVTSARELAGLVGAPTPAALRKVRTRLHGLDRQWLAASPLCFVATADGDGHQDVSPKGDPAGLAHVLDDVTIAIPERPGNRRADGFHNVLANPHVGLLFVIPGRGDTLRVNGTARLLRGVPYAEELRVRGHVPRLVLEVTVEEVFHHCSKAFLRSRTWDPDAWTPDAMPRRAVLARTLERPEDSLDVLDAHYGPRYAEHLYG
ncbi:MSMEG_1061 family FMN-dependent PPOX-type flavoprotein [Isoptericola sp. BMS4]|uniref:MSMEG_1061 family FMN-dependent PPOX-type flavoprotein n=1 Tax=Isoptericola sp. BMS4 TaxID=2527875 RepID=UPI001423A50B|nr:MSMEG_1061 family FMN-dependent PPOX-type flavoprotein [Isoptericola sp. BMS4]